MSEAAWRALRELPRPNLAKGGTRLLVETRKRLLRELDRNPLWKPVVEVLTRLLESAFQPAQLRLRGLDSRSPKALLDKLIQHEAVHPIHSREELRRRLRADRRCFALTHRALPGELLIFAEVALTQGLSSKIQPLLDPKQPVLPPETADHAMFYSISSCQEGLRGIPFGGELIERAMQALKDEFPKLERFATLSPVPGLRDWMARYMPSLDLMKLRDPRWMCAHYLLKVRRGGEPWDPVARFHLRNGARLERVNALEDISGTGMERSAGFMVNYVYRPEEIQRNRTAYLKTHAIAASPEVEALAR